MCRGLVMFGDARCQFFVCMLLRLKLREPIVPSAEKGRHLKYVKQIKNEINILFKLIIN